MPADDLDALRERLLRLDGRGYPAYKDLRGRHALPGFDLYIDHVQGDPFAAPSRLRVAVPRAAAAAPDELVATPLQRTALCDHLARVFTVACERASRACGSGASGRIETARPGQEILPRSSVVLTDTHLEGRFRIGLPASGRRIRGRAAAELLCEAVPELVAAALTSASLDRAAAAAHVAAAEDAAALRSALRERGLVAFVADGAVLPRRSGVDDRPMQGTGVRAFAAPPTLRVTLETPHAGAVTGMGVPRGVTLIVGGGYHGKSTLLHAIERGVYDHIPGDGRERVVSSPDAVKVRAEDGRPVTAVDLRPFLNGLPGGVDAARFSTANASGSTSQAAAIVEALETGADCLLLDEDTCATNLMLRDARMQRLVETEGEPITPYLDRVRELAEGHGVSSVLVLGGCGDYFDAADTVIRMADYAPRDVTATAREVAQAMPTQRAAGDAGPWPTAAPRHMDCASLDPSRGRRAVHVRTHALRSVTFGRTEIDLTYVEQLVDSGQVRAIGLALESLRHGREPAPGLAAAVADATARVAHGGLDVLTREPQDDLVGFRRHELAAALNRLRGLVCCTRDGVKGG